MSSDQQIDLIHRFLFDDSDLRGELVTLEQSFQQAASPQNLPKVFLPLYGEFMAAAALVADMLKFEGTITLQARSNGPLPLIMAEANSKGHVRGFAQVDEQQSLVQSDSNELLPLAALLGGGVLSITIDPDKGKRYQGIVPLDGADLAECLQHYFSQSEQLPTYFKLFANENKAGGIFLQCLPAQLVKDEEQREENWQTARHLASTTKAEEALDLDHPTLLYRLYHELQCRVFPPKQLSFRCHCSKERSANAIKTLGEVELQALIDEQGKVDMSCQFCGSNYHFDKTQLEGFKKELGKRH
ncbi:Hsp33 family molecular chaperone HslO [Agaribacterium sp. ZY112]|uniref:Hsp33 family molecular chaperone HslO n=1 Tax=Agaribacterium sp. ZY112 TaxID=3233574 RepID=UPI003525840D